jgi:Eco57I restriction-modification methylase
MVDKKEMLEKKKKGQFYTVNSSYILDGLSMPPQTARCIIEPFAGKGDLLDWLPITHLPIELYDIDPKKEGIIQRDTLMNPPNYADSWILTNPPYLARNKCNNKEVYDKYETNDLYKCFITSLTNQEKCAAGGIFIIPAGFFFSPRDLDVRCRNDFLSKYKLLKVKYFEETVFPDTTTTVVAFVFEKSPILLHEQCVEWISFPSGSTRVFNMTKIHDWIIGGDIYKLPIPTSIKIRRHVQGQKLREGEQITFITLSALDSGTKDGGRICLEYKEGYIYPAKDCSRTYATLCIQANRFLSSEEQQKICKEFNTLIEKKRDETWSLFLPQFRESKEYARKRIPFELAYRIVLHLLL